MRQGKNSIHRTAGYVTRSSGGVGGRGREASSYPDWAPPSGRLLLALEGTHAAGCVALRAREDGVCEMKRLFVRPDSRGQGLGRLLALQAVSEATALGYVVMRLDTLDTLDSAIRIYAAMGFQRRTPYYANPLPSVAYWERALSNRTPASMAEGSDHSPYDPVETPP